MRLFIALEFEPKEYFFGIQKQISGDGKLNFTKTFHLTLKFLGEVNENRVDEIKKLISEIKFNSFSAETSNIGFFPSENYIRVVWIGLEPKRDILELQQQVDKKLLSFFPKEKNFEPHITLARVKFLKDKKDFVEKIKEIKIEKKVFEIKNFKLIKSTLASEGPVYEDLGVFELK